MSLERCILPTLRPLMCIKTLVGHREDFIGSSGITDEKRVDLPGIELRIRDYFTY